jgi:hypothetical protein
MAQLAPPPPPPLRVRLAEHDYPDHLNLRLRLVWLTALSVLGTAWLCTLGPIPAIIALVVEKHVLVALLVMGLGVDAGRRTEV